MVIRLPVEDVDQTLRDLEQKGEYEKVEGLRTVLEEYGRDASYTFLIDPRLKPNGWWIEISKDIDQRPFMREVADDILNNRKRGIYTRMIFGNNLAEKMARELLELAESINPIHYDAFGRLYREYLSLKDKQIKKTDWSYTRIMT